MAITAPANGTLGLSSPWARQAVPEPLRATLAALVPPGWVIGVSVSADRAWYRAWCIEPGVRTVGRCERRTAEAAVRAAIAWLRANA